MLGLSGGVDSAICAAMAVDALGEERVRCVMMPYHYTSKESFIGRGSLRQGAWRSLRDRADRRAGGRLHEDAGAGLRRHQFRHHRGEPAIARARRHPDGDFQQVRLDGGDDRQQERNECRLCHALRRHEWRLQPDQGPLQDAGLPAGGLAQRQRAGRVPRAVGRGHSRQHPEEGALGGTAAQPDRPGFAAALSDARRHPGKPGRTRDVGRGHRRRRA